MLEITDLRKSYGEVTALDGVSFTVDGGQICGFVGPNGSGKTTTMRIVLGVLEADSGEVRWDGSELDPDSRRRIGYMPEERGLYPKMRVGEQLAYLAELHGVDESSAAEGAQRWLERLGVADRTDDLVEQLSLGNQQRVQLAAALVHEPDMLILDEPFSGLDPVGVDVLSEVLVSEARQREIPVVFSSHQLELVERLCDSVAIIAAGRLVASGTVMELREVESQNRWRVEVQGADPGWEGSVPGVRDTGDATFELAHDTDPQQLLAVAQRAGKVVHFAPQEASLSELFRDAVAEKR